MDAQAMIESLRANPDPDALALARRITHELGISVGALFVPTAEFTLAVALAFGAGAQTERAEACMDRYCRVCGCTHLHGCGPEPCSWVARDLCSACAPFVT